MNGSRFSRPVKDVNEIIQGKYQVISLIQSKGMSNVYVVQDLSLGKTWVLKEINKNHPGEQNIEYDSIVREANVMSKLEHPGIPRITEISETEDSLYIIIDYINGVSVQTILHEDGPIPETEAVNWMEQVSAIIGYLHNLPNPLFYRDLKPDNIMVQSDGVVRILDFGISEIISPGNEIILQPLGTVGYASPEQALKGEKYDLRSDIYSFGVTLFYMLTGISPMVWRRGNKTRPYSIRAENPKLSPGLERVVLKCTAEDPNQRYQSIEEVQYALRHYNQLDDSYHTKLRNRIRMTVASLVVGVLLLGGAGVVYAQDRIQEGEEYAVAVAAAEQTGRYQDYVEAISMNPRKLAPYRGLINSIKTKGEFDTQTEEEFLGLMNPNLSSLANDPEWPEIAMEIGKLYWFFYDGPENGQVLSVKWFKDALAGGIDDSDQAGVFYQMGVFQRDISSSIKEGDDVGMYKDYWENLLTTRNYVTGEVAEIQSRILMAQAIDQYSYRLKSDGVSEEELQEVADELKDFAFKTQVSPGAPEELMQELKSVTAGLDSKIKAGYQEVQ